MRSTIAVLCVLLACCEAEEAGAPEEDSPVAALLAKLDEKALSLQAYTLSGENTTEVSTADFSQSSVYNSTIAWKRAGEQVLYRMEMKGKTEMTVAGSTTSSDNHTIMVVDGKYSWTENEMAPGVKMVMKADITTPMDNKPSDLFAALSDQYDARLLEAAEVDGLACHVIELSAKADVGPGSMPRLVYYFTEEHGLLMKSVGFDADGKVSMTNVMEDLEIDPEIEDQTFSYEPPEGAQIVDMTGEKD